MRKIVLILALLLPGLVGAKEPSRHGKDVRAWTELQKGGNAALAAPRPMSGEVADKVYERYLNSFASPIPESFSRERFVSGGSSSR